MNAQSCETEASQRDDSSSSADPRLPHCELCGLSFTAQDDLEEHMEAYHLKDIEVADKMFDCQNCRRSFLTIDYFEAHNQMMHAPQ